MIKRIMLLAGLGLAIGAVIYFRPIYWDWLSSYYPSPVRDKAGIPEVTEVPRENIRCYFPATEGYEPVEEVRERPTGDDPLQKLRGVMEELHRGPERPGALLLFQPGTTLRSSFLAADGTAYLDYPSRTLDLPVGPREEFLFMRCLARTLLRNCPEVKAFVIIVDGNARHRLLLHLPAHGRYVLPRS